MENKIVLDDWQKQILDCKAKYILLCKGRQIGGTFIFARKCAMRLVSQKGCRIVVASITEDQAQLVIAMVLNYLDENHKKLIKRPYSRNVTKSIINLTTGSQIRSRAVGLTGNAVRGFTGHVLYLNEASRMPEFIFEAAKPILLTTAGDIWMDSTPFGMEGYFYRSFQNKNNRFKVFYHTSEEIMKNRQISESWTVKQRDSALQFLEDEKKDMTKLQYKQEYMGLFVGGLQRLFLDELLKKCLTFERPHSISKKYNHYLGVDIARMGEDEGTYEIIRKINNKNFEHVENIITRKKLTTETEQKIIDLEMLYSFKEIGLDAGAGTLGVSVLDHLLEVDSTKRKVIALNSRKVIQDRDDKSRIKIFNEDMYNNLKSMMERGELKLLNDEKVWASLASIQFEYVIKEGQPTKLRIFGVDNHVAEGLIRAAELAKKDKSLKVWVDYI